MPYMFLHTSDQTVLGQRDFFITIAGGNGRAEHADRRVRVTAFKAGSRLAMNVVFEFMC